MKNALIYTAVALSLLGCKKEEEKQPEAPQKFVLTDAMMKSVKISEVQNSYISDENTFYGKISADKNNYVDVYPLVGGNVMKVFVNLGDYVHKGQTLATVRSSEGAGYLKDVGVARATLLSAQNALRVAQQMHQSQLNTDKDVMDAKIAVQQAQQELQRATSVTQVYNFKNGNTYSVVSPINGYIVQKNITTGMQLRSDNTNNIFDVANTADVWAVANIDQSDIDKIKVGMKAEVTSLADPDKVYTGKIDKINKIVDPNTNFMQAIVFLPNAGGQLVMETKATIKTISQEDKMALSIPSKAIIFDDNRNYVVVYRSPKDLEIRMVTILRKSGETTYIAEGLHEGEKIISENQLLIYNSLKG